jgi:tRNA A22 N-methylase
MILLGIRLDFEVRARRTGIFFVEARTIKNPNFIIDHTTRRINSMMAVQASRRTSVATYLFRSESKGNSMCTMNHCFVIKIILAASMISIIFTPVPKIGCYAFRPVARIRNVNKRHLCRYRYNGNKLQAGNKYWKNPSFGLYSSSARRYDGLEERDAFHESVSAYLFRHGRTWRRLSHLLEMATYDSDQGGQTIMSSTKNIETVADIGTDHGLLAIGLALTGDYNNVVGVDISDQALTYGALATLDKIRNQTMGVDSDYFEDLPIEFRCGNGLEALDYGEAETICIAGMGVNTMLQILEQKSSTSSDITNLEKVGCKRLVLQSPNSRPRNLIRLYDRLQTVGWKVRDERIEKLSSRWYVTTRFDMITNNYTSDMHHSDKDHVPVELELPGMRLQSLDKSSSMSEVFDEYCRHHKQWIEQERDAKASAKQQIDSRDLRWLEFFFDQ